MTSLVGEMALKSGFYSKNRDGGGKRTRGKSCVKVQSLCSNLLDVVM